MNYMYFICNYKHVHVRLFLLLFPTFPLISLVPFIELPWDAPTNECAEYREWSNQNYFFSPWSKISNEPLGTCTCTCIYMYTCVHVLYMYMCMCMSSFTTCIYVSYIYIHFYIKERGRFIKESQ